MKKLSFLFCSLMLYFSSFSQAVYIPSKGSVTAKPISPSAGVPTDGRTYFYDSLNFRWRPFLSTSEVLSFLNSQSLRRGHFPIIVNSGGTLSNGVITGGTNQEYWFKDGIANGDLVLKSAGSGATSNTILGTVAQLRAMNISPTNAYFSTDIPGLWHDAGPYDGQTPDDGGKYIVSANNRVLERNDLDGKIHLSWYGAGNSAALNKALAYNNAILIDRNVMLEANLTIPQNKVIEIAKGAIISTATASVKLLIEGKLIAGSYQIFDTAANVKARPYSVERIYPEWWGAVALASPRMATTASGAFNSTTAFKKAADFIESYTYLAGVHGSEIFLGGWYGIKDQINFVSSVTLRGLSPIFDGSGIRWIDAGDSSKSLVKFMHAETGGVFNVGFKSNKSANVALRSKAAIELNQPDWNTFTQRRLLFDNIYIGDPIGFFAEGTEREFVNGFLCSGMSANNDFHNFKNLMIANCMWGIHTETDQSIDWRIENYGFGDGDVMYRSDNGGDLFGDGWYVSPNVSEGVLSIGGSIGSELRINLSNFSSEHMQAKYFLNTESRVRLKLSGSGIFQINGDYQPNGFALLQGNGLTAGGVFRFENTTFNYEQPATPRKMFIEQFGNNAVNMAVQFVNCTGSKDLFFKFPNPVNRNNSTYTHLTFEGEISQTVQTDKKIVVNARNAGAFFEDGANWLSIADLFNSETETGSSALTVGQKGKSTLATMGVKTSKVTTIEGFSQSVPDALPPNSIIKGVTAMTVDANALFQNGDYISVGIGNNERMFGVVYAPNAEQYNTQPSSMFITSDTAEDLVLKGWREIGNNPFTLTGNTLTATSPSTFVPGMVGGIVRFRSGNVLNREVLITGFTSSTQVTVANPDTLAASGELAAVQVPINPDKNLMLYVSYEQVSRFKNEVDPNTFYTTPAISATARPIVLNEKQIVYNKFDSSGLTRATGGSGGTSITSYLQLSDRPAIPTLTGTANYVLKATGSNSTANSIIVDDGAKLGIGTPFAHPAFTMDVQSNGAIFRDAGTDNGFYIFNHDGMAGSGIQAVNYGSTGVKALFINYGGGSVRIGSTVAPDAALSVTGNFSATGRATVADAIAANEAVTLGQMNNRFEGTAFTLRSSLSPGYRLIYSPDSTKGIVRTISFLGTNYPVVTENDTTLYLDFSDFAHLSGTQTFTGQKTFTASTFFSGQPFITATLQPSAVQADFSILTRDNSSGRVESVPGSRVLNSLAVLPEFANNAIAVDNGLANGDFYRTGDVVKQVHP